MSGPATLQQSWPFLPRYKMIIAAAELVLVCEAERRGHSSPRTTGFWRRDAEVEAGKENMNIMLLEKVTFIIFQTYLLNELLA